MKKSIFIFDFDGTIADTYHYIIEISNRLAEEFKFAPIHWDEIEDLKNKTSQEIIAHLQVPVMKIPAILAKAKKEYNNDLSRLQPIKGLTDILHKLKELGTFMGIFSSNSNNNVCEFLAAHQLNIFDFVHTTPKVWSKNIGLKNLINSNGFDLSQIIYIGDETRDIVAAQRLGIKVAAVAWGYNSPAALEKQNPDYLLNTPTDLLNLLNRQK